jgi:hypothetical protein
MDLEIAATVSDGIFTHPMWTSQYIDSFVWPYVQERRPDSKVFPIVSGAIIVTGNDGLEIERSRAEAKRRLFGYFRSHDYDFVFRQLGVMDEVAVFREASATVKDDPWDSKSSRDLYCKFVSDSAFDKLGSALRNHTGEHITGLFPNIMSAIPRLLPSAIVTAIVGEGRPT